MRSVIAVAVLAATSCTSFSFKKDVKGSAPSDLQDPSTMAELAGGTFEMGFDNGDPDEYPKHKLKLRPFSLDIYEVTRKDYARCVDASVCKKVPDLGTPDVDDTHPVIGVTWFQAKTYCEWVGKRLPTEAEWEYAARAPHQFLYPWGGSWEQSRANSRTPKDGYDFTAPVGTFPTGKNPKGIHDLAGNAAEWTADWYDAKYYHKTPDANPTGPEVPTGERVVRGGSWSDPDHLLRAVTRLAQDPNVSNSAIGFRCAR